MSYGLSKPPCKLIQLSFPEGKREDLLARLFFGNPVNPLTAITFFFSFFPFSLFFFPPSFFYCCRRFLPLPLRFRPVFLGAKNYFRAIERFTWYENTQPINFQAECFKALNRVQRGSFIVAEIAFFKLVIWKMILFDLLGNAATSGRIFIRKNSCNERMNAIT